MKNSSISLTLITLLALVCIPVGQLGIDIYLPSLPAMASDLNSGPALMQLSLTVYILSEGVAQLFYGPLSDYFGRRPTLLWGLSIFFVSTVLCMVSRNACWLLLARFLQGVGAGACFVVCNGIFADLFTGPALARRITYSSLAWSVVPIIAPFLGGYVQQYLGWRINFLIILIYAALLLIAIALYLPETLSRQLRHSIHPKALLKSHLAILTRGKFIGFVICVAFTYGAVIAFNVTGPFILQEALGISAAQYGLCVLIVGVIYSIGTFLNSLLLKRFQLITLLSLGVIWTILSGVLLCIFWWYGWITVVSIILGTAILQLAQGLIFANSLSASLELFATQRGTVSAIFGFLVLMGCTAISAVISYLHIVTEWQLGLVYILLGLLASVGLLLAI